MRPRGCVGPAAWTRARAAPTVSCGGWVGAGAGRAGPTLGGPASESVITRSPVARRPVLTRPNLAGPPFPGFIPPSQAGSVAESSGSNSDAALPDDLVCMHIRDPVKRAHGQTGFKRVLGGRAPREASPLAHLTGHVQMRWCSLVPRKKRIPLLKFNIIISDIIT